MAVKIFGIRHHGTGSAKSLLKSLNELKPDCILIEGPPDADDIIHLAKHEGMKPPVSILVYSPEKTEKSVIYPFAVFSPEWQAIQYALKNEIKVNFIDLPMYYQFSDDLEKEKELSNRVQDPIGILAKASSFSDGESWWDNFVENRKDTQDIFIAIEELMTHLREETESETDKREALREAHMRKMLRKAIKDGYKNIAVIVGAWHVLALNLEKFQSKNDDLLLKSLEKTKTTTTWIPWTYNRLSFKSGYGAGVESPGWYHHLWNTEKDVTIKWVAKVADVFRKKDLEVSSAHLIETVRLAETLAVIREKNSVGLEELNESIKTVMCFGSSLPLSLVKEELIIGKKLGKVAPEVPITPLQKDFYSLVKKYRLKQELNAKELILDLRKENDLEKSIFLHQLRVLQINWAVKSKKYNQKGTFNELWILEWNPEFEILLVEAGIWGNSIKKAANSLAIDKAEKSKEIQELTELLQEALLAGIPEALSKITQRLEDEASLSYDVIKLMRSVFPLANVLRYGNVRKTDSDLVKNILDGIIPRVCIGLVNACSGINYDSANELIKPLTDFDNALKMLEYDEYLISWEKTLSSLSELEIVNPLISGFSNRLLLEKNKIEIETVSKRMSLALSLAGDITKASNWLEGFLKGSGIVLINNDKLLEIIDKWIINLNPDIFIEILPIIRRNFSSFSNAERRQIGEKIKQKDGQTSIVEYKEDPNFSISQAEKVLPILKILLSTLNQ